MTQPTVYTMRKPCEVCQATTGSIATTNGQDVVRCSNGHFCYNAPKTETGRDPRPVLDERDPIKPSLRVSVLQRDGGRCQLCGRRENLHAGHCAPLHLAKEHPEWLSALGLTLDDLNDPLNLVTLCDACNLGMGSHPIAPKIYVLLLTKWLCTARGGDS